MTTITALVTSLITSATIFIILLLVFLRLSRYAVNAVIYYPARIIAGRQNPDGKSESLMEWLPQAWNATDEEMIRFAGLDAFVYVRLHVLCLKILAWASIYCLTVLLPVNAVGGYFGGRRAFNLHVSDFTFDNLSMGNIAAGSSLMWLHALGVWWVSLGTLYLLHKGYQEISQLRVHHLSRDAPQPEQLAVLFRDIPKPEGRASYGEHVNGLLTRLHGSAYKRSILLPKLDKALAKWKELESTRRKLGRAQLLLERSFGPGNPQGKRPQHRSKFWGLWGDKVDSIEVYTDKLTELSRELAAEQERLRAEGRVHAAVALFNSRSVAAAAAQVVHSQQPDQWLAQPAPAPADVVWENAPLPHAERQLRGLLVFAAVALTILFYMIPITFISGLTTLHNLKRSLPFLKGIVDKPFVATILQAYLPQLALIVFLTVLPYILQYLSYLEGLPSQSDIVLSATSKFYYFTVLNIFLGVTITGGLFQALHQVVDEPGSLLQLLGSSLPTQAAFFVTFIALSFFVRHGLELSQLLRLVLYHLQRPTCVTEEDHREAWNPGPMPYLFNVPSDLLTITLGLCYSVVAPLVLPFAALYHAFSWVVMKHQALNVYVAEYDSGGRMFPLMHTRIVVALLVFQLSMIGYLGIKKFTGAPFLAPLPFLTAYFLRYETLRFHRSFRVNFLDIAAAVEDREASLPIRELEDAYTPGCLKGASSKLEPLNVLKVLRSFSQGRTP